MDLTFRDQQSGKQGNITLDGNLTVSQAGEVRMLLIKALIDAEQVRVDFGSVTDIDLSCLQLLCSAHRSASRMKKSVSLSDDWPELFKKTVEEAGYSRLAGCHLDVDHSCLWVRR
ncbi:MAG TPA: STAS domain-containing protein [Nitrospirota bacterium]|nr:STAS domain-containing protein [Nitrospirota bacterium]